MPGCSNRDSKPGISFEFVSSHDRNHCGASRARRNREEMRIYSANKVLLRTVAALVLGIWAPLCPSGQMPGRQTDAQRAQAE